MPKSMETEIKQAVRRHYAELAALNQSCCNPDASLRKETDVPKEAVQSSASCGLPLTHVELAPGSVVLDLGSGAGIDVFQASKVVGPTGKVVGVDATPEMIFKARELAAKYDYRNVEFRLGEIEHLPVESDSIDLATSNCVLNLVPDKQQAFNEIYRVLKPGGHIAVSDMVATSSARKELIDPDEWAACIAGAVTVDEYKNLLEKAGFREIRHFDENAPIDQTCCSQGLPVKSVAWLAVKPPD
jgi:arsenite methyltransferase